MLLLATQVAGGMKGAALCLGAKTRWSGACARSKPKAAAVGRPYGFWTVSHGRSCSANRRWARAQYRAGL